MGLTFRGALLCCLQYCCVLIYQEVCLKMTKEMEEQYTTVGGTPHLDGGYTVFGQVTEGMDVVDRIQHVECDANDRPLEDVRIIKATILRDLPGMEKKPKKVVRRVAKKTIKRR
jgi:hypothetical protein